MSQASLMTENESEAGAQVWGGVGGKALGDEVREVGGNRGSQRIMYGFEGRSTKSRLHSKCNGKTQEGFE